MKSGPSLTPRGDEASDPLLAALRHHLGNYGQAPPPGAWAAIRQQLPPPAQRRFLLGRRVALLLGLLLGLVLAGWLVVRPGGQPAAVAVRLAATLPAGPAPTGGPSASQSVFLARRRPALAPIAPAGSRPLGAATTRLRPQASAPHPAAASVSHHRGRGTDRNPADFPAAASVAKPGRTLTRVLGLPGSGQRHHWASQPAARPQAALAKRQGAIRRSLVSAVRNRATYAAGATRPASASSPSQASMASSRPLEALQPNLVKLVLVSASLPHAPVAKPGSQAGGHAPLPAGRRWSLQLLAGPTYSYRSLGNGVMRQAIYVDFPPLERPALGLGAQVQVRRVLSGHWALAVGVGYHQYATRLVRDTAFSKLPLNNRDTYNLLTLPVQVGYTLGTAHGRLATALLAGAEPGWFLSGRSTENTLFPNEQQRYSSAENSPYRPWNLAFSLGLDLRYRLGEPDSRWHLVVQPTGRYVLTPFVRNNTGFTQRQPFSLGLFAGLSRDL